MSEKNRSILQIPRQEIDRFRCSQVDLDRLRGREIAGPIFDADFIKLALAQRIDFPGNMHREVTHWFHLILQGNMKFRLERETVIAKPGDLVCIPAGITTSKTSSGPVRWIYVEIKDTPIWEPLKETGPSVRKYESADLMYILVSSITGAMKSQDVYSIRCAFESSQMLVTLLKRELGQSINEWSSGQMGRLTGLLDRIREHPTENWNRSTMAQKVNMSDRTLGRVFQRTFNMSPAKMVISIRMDLATRLLRNTEKSLTEIASEVGYDSPFSFSRLFKKYVGVPPRRYRARAQEQGASPDTYPADPA